MQGVYQMGKEEDVDRGWLSLPYLLWPMHITQSTAPLTTEFAQEEANVW